MPFHFNAHYIQHKLTQKTSLQLTAREACMDLHLLRANVAQILDVYITPSSEFVCQLAHSRKGTVDMKCVNVQHVQDYL